MNVISVIIPVYKVEPYLRQCLDSVVNQTYKNLEIIIIDDGSPDDCGVICDEYADRDCRIKVVHKRNEGLSAARNDGIRLATGEWLTFIDSDDWLELNYFYEMAKILEVCQPDVLCAGGSYQNKGDQQIIARYFYTQRTWNEDDNKELIIAKVLTGQAEHKVKKGERPVRLASAWDKICKTSFIKSQGILFDVNDKAYEDVWYSLLVVSQASKIVGCDCIGYHYRFVDNSITKGYNPRKCVINHENLDKTILQFRCNNSKIIHSAMIAYGLDLFVNGLLCSTLHPLDKKNYKEKAIEIKNVKRMPRFHEVLQSHDNRYLTLRAQIKGIIFRLPGAWQIILLYSIKRKVEAIKQWLLERR